MLSWDDVARVCRALPGTTEATSTSGRRRWLVRGRTFLRERPLQQKDLAELGDTAPAGPVLVACVPDVGAKAALLEVAAEAWAGRAPAGLRAGTASTAGDPGPREA